MWYLKGRGLPDYLIKKLIKLYEKNSYLFIDSGICAINRFLRSSP